MVGYGVNKGIVPLCCDDIFTRINQKKSSTVQYEVFVSMLEIYNEKVQDLLVALDERPKGGLKIREHKIFGVYVD